MLRFCLSVAGFLMAAASVAGAPVQVTGGSLESLEGSSTLVTVVLKSSFARDMNLIVSSVEGDLIRFTDETGASVVYQANDIAEVRVQRDRIEWSSGVSSSPLQREDVAGALRKAGERAEQIFAANQQPSIQVLASEVAGASGSSDAIAFLERAVLSGDSPSAVKAWWSLYALGQRPPGETLRLGVRSSDRETKGAAAQLAGVAGLESIRDTVVELVKDPAPAVFRGAAIGCGYFGDSRALPYLLRALNTTEKDKANAAVFALARIGGDEVRREMHTRAQTASGSEWYHSIRVLYLLGDPLGVELLRGELRSNSPYGVQTALMLAEDDYWDANVFLRQYLDTSRDTSPEGYEERIAAASLLLSKGYVQAKAHLRQILAMNPKDIYVRGKLNDDSAHLAAHNTLKAQLCLHLAVRAEPSMLQLLLTAVDDQNPAVALLAGRAIMAVSIADYRERIATLHAPRL